MFLYLIHFICSSLMDKRISQKKWVFLHHVAPLKRQHTLNNFKPHQLASLDGSMHQVEETYPAPPNYQKSPTPLIIASLLSTGVR